MLTSWPFTAKFILHSVCACFIHKVRRHRVVQFYKYSPNSRCRPSSCLLAVLAMFLANSSPNQSPSWNDWNERNNTPFCIQPRPQVFLLTVQKYDNFAALLWHHQFTYRKVLPNLVESSWLWWIMPRILAN